MSAIIKIRDLKKYYGDFCALNGINLDVEQGSLYGIIGADGAGKTTLFRLLTTLLLPSQGNVEVDHLDTVKDYKQIRQIIGYMPNRFALYPDLTVEENLKFFATIFHTSIDENRDSIRDVYKQLEPFKKRKAGKLSGGMKQKLALSCAIIHSPKILFLDEPTTGVDAVSRKEFWETLKNLKSQGITIVVSTPYMDEAILCDEIALIQEGELLKIDTPSNIVADYPEILWAVKSDHMHKLLADLRNYDGIKTAFSFGEWFHATVDKTAKVANLKDYLTSNGHSDVEILRIEASIEDCFMLLMKKKNEC